MCRGLGPTPPEGLDLLSFPTVVLGSLGKLLILRHVNPLRLTGFTGQPRRKLLATSAGVRARRRDGSSRYPGDSMEIRLSLLSN